MLSGEGNAGERWKTTVGLISKKSNFARVAHFFVHFFFGPLFCTTTTWNFQKRFSYTFLGGNVVRVLVNLFFFFTAAHFHFALVAAIISHFVTAATKFSCCSSNKNNVSIFLSLTLDLCHPFSRWAPLICRLLSLFLCLSLSLYSKFVDMTVNLSLTL